MQSARTRKIFEEARRGRLKGCCIDAGETYGVAGGKFLFGADDGSATLSLVDCSLSSHDSLPLRGASTGLAPNFGNGVPIV